MIVLSESLDELLQKGQFAEGTPIPTEQKPTELEVMQSKVDKLTSVTSTKLGFLQMEKNKWVRERILFDSNFLSLVPEDLKNTVKSL